jgi:ribosomal protein S18 acetylase RimI-like enzyme
MEQEDVNEVLRVRTLARENALSMDELASLGITPESTSSLLEEDAKGWVCEESGEILGFTMGDGRSGEVLVLAVLPQHEGRGIGRRLLDFVEGWLFSKGHPEVWLRTNPDPSLRAYGFYRSLGWLPTGEYRGNEQVLKLRRDGAGRAPNPASGADG